MCHARKERAVVIGTDQRITSGPAATTAASRGRIHGCTRIVSRKVRFFSLAPRAPSIHGHIGLELANVALTRRDLHRSLPSVREKSLVQKCSANPRSSAEITKN